MRIRRLGAVNVWVGLVGVALLGAAVSARELPDVGFPRILIHNFDERPPMPRAQIEALAQRDLVILSSIFRKDYEDIAAIRALNPNIIILQYALTFQAGFDDRAALSNDEEAALFLSHPETWLTTTPLAALAQPLSSDIQTLSLSAPLPDFATAGWQPVLLCDGELMRVESAEGKDLKVRRGWLKSAPAEHAQGAALCMVTQPFDGFFFDEGQGAVSTPQADLSRDGKADEPLEVQRAMDHGLQLMCERLRERCGDDTILLLNNNRNLVPSVNGRHCEHFADVLADSAKGPNARTPWMFGNWAYSTEPCRAWLDTGHPPSLVANSSQPGTWTDRRQVRFGLASALLFDGFFQYRAHSGDKENWSHWFDEYSVDTAGKATDGTTGRHWLGRPLGPARQATQALTTPNLVAGAAWALDVTRPGLAQTRLESEGGVLRATIDALRSTKPGAVSLSAPGTGALKPTSEYTLDLEVRASSPRLVDFSIAAGKAKGASSGSRIQIPLYVKSQWERHVLTCFNASDKPLQPYQLVFGLGRDEGTVELRGTSWREGTEEGVWTREFEHGAVVVSPTRQPQTAGGLQGFRKILGMQDPAHNNGGSVPASLTVAPLDAYLLWRVAEIPH
ncbi:MAG: putative glycoside hydrolase [Candidatus Sumerlaeota bacterium]|nr:putative glycoside hydrolase [Candidatus Sumerlaeota bacterium]